MKKEDKEILLKDLSVRLPYGTKFHYSVNNYLMEIIGIDAYSGTVDAIGDEHRFPAIPIEDVKPYLRPISSMTDVERQEFVNFHCLKLFPIIDKDCLTLENELRMFCWLNAHHFDYRGLIEKGLALEAPEGMYK